jgi:hypothetical protein
MYASYIEGKMKTGTSAEAIELAQDLIPEVGEIPNLTQFIRINKGDDEVLLLAFYNTAEEQESATPKAGEVMSKIGHLFATPPERAQLEVPINHTYLTSPAGG